MLVQLQSGDYVCLLPSLLTIRGFGFVFSGFIVSSLYMYINHWCLYEHLDVSWLYFPTHPTALWYL